jgi:hypothetical protein
MGTETNYSVFLAELASTPGERRSILHRYIEPTDEDRQESRKFRPRRTERLPLGARGYVRVLVTTNFDRLIENALRPRVALWIGL